MGQTRGERIRELRKSLGLTQEKFGMRIGVGKAAISVLEKGTNSLTDSMAKLICQTFHVNEAWLLDGAGEMFAEVPDALLGELYRRYDCSETSQWIIEEFLKLDPEEQDVIYQYIRNVYLRSTQQAAAPDADQAVSRDAKDFPPGEDSEGMGNSSPGSSSSMLPQGVKNAPDAADPAGSANIDIERKVEDYRRRLELEERREGLSDASSQGSATA